MMNKSIVDSLEKEHIISDLEYRELLLCEDTIILDYLAERAREVRHKIYRHDVYIRGLIELTNYCKNNCLYCGIRCGNMKAERYRLSAEQIFSSVHTGYKLGFRSFVLQGGEDKYFTDEKLCYIIGKIKEFYPDVAVTLSIGERSEQSYELMYKAGADRYLLRHETANKRHYECLHPKEMSFENRIQCLKALKKIGYQVGCGFMVGSPYQTLDNIVEDLKFIYEFKPHMVGIGPFIPHKDTPFRDKSAGSSDMTIKLLSIIRLMIPNILLPATTALSTVDELGREKGILAGANVIMPNLSPLEVRKKYLLYDNKACLGDEAAEGVNNLKVQLNQIGYNVVVNRGDCIIIN